MRNLTKFAKDQSHQYVVVDFDNVTEKGLKKLITALDKAGSTVASTEAPNKQQKRDGEAVKRAKFFFAKGQTMTLFIGDAGDIFQLTLNSTKQPIPSVKNERELAREMTRLLERNQPKFDKQQERKATRKVKDTSDTKPASRSLAKRTEEAETAVNNAQINVSSAETALKETNAKLAEVSNQVSALEKELEAEKQETKELEEQLEAN